MYAAALLFIYVPLSIWSKQRALWAIISIVTACELMARLLYGHNDMGLYVVRSTAALLGGMSLLTLKRNGLAMWQSGVYFSTLLAYAALAVDVAANRHILIYNYFEAVIHGLVACQLGGIFYPMALSFVRDGSGTTSWLGHLFKRKEVAR